MRMFYRPCRDDKMMFVVLDETNYLKVFNSIIKAIVVFVMNQFSRFKFTAKVLLHNISVFIWPRSNGLHFYDHIFYTPAFYNFFSVKRERAGVTHTTRCGTNALAVKFWISVRTLAVITLKRIVKCLAIFSSSSRDWFSANTTRFEVKLFWQGDIYIPTQTKCQRIYGLR